jgi:hypothetical protein
VKADDYANCAQCGQARLKRVLNADGVCPWCLLRVILTVPNPYLKRDRMR